MKIRLGVLLIVLMYIISGCAESKAPEYTGPASVLPLPVSMEMKQGSFALMSDATIFVKPADEKQQGVGEYLSDELGKLGITVNFAASVSAENDILLTDTGAAHLLNKEGYILEISPNGIVVRATEAAGFFYGVQTLLQLAEKKKSNGEETVLFPNTKIWDEPRFSWRGLMLDCSRTFWTKEDILRYIDLLALHKMNVFHLHLTDDQGFRVEIKSYPKLTEQGARFDARYPNETGGFYSQEDIREIVAYAAERFITIVPEIDLPGHFTAGVVAYPWLSCTGRDDLWVYPFTERPEHIANLTEDILCAGNDRVYEFLDAVFTELIDLFPSEYIHIGGDEAPKARWEKCPKCQAMIKKHGLHDEHELQSYMTSYLAEFLEKRGRKLIGWDEIIEGGLAENAAVMYWRGWIGDAVEHAVSSGNVVVQSPTSHCYFDYTYDTISTEHAYGFEPIPEGLSDDEAALIIGVQANMWTHLARDIPSLDRQLFPRLAAIAEVGWSPKEKRDLSNFKERLGNHYARLGALGVSYFVPMPDGLPGNAVFRESVEVALESPIEGGTLRYTLDGSEPSIGSTSYTVPFSLSESATVKAAVFLADGNVSPIRSGLYTKKAIEPSLPAKKEQGLSYRYCEQRFTTVDDIRDADTTRSGTIGSFTIPSGVIDDGFGLEFNGFIEIKTDGFYTFSTISDDGSKLWIADMLVVDNDGFHGAVERSGIIELKTGFYPITVRYLEAGGGESLEVLYEGPGVLKQVVPGEVLWRE